jgi:hypothetical protein
VVCVLPVEVEEKFEPLKVGGETTRGVAGIDGGIERAVSVEYSLPAPLTMSFQSSRSALACTKSQRAS